MTLLCVGCYWADISAFTKNGCYSEPARGGLAGNFFCAGQTRFAAERGSLLAAWSELAAGDQLSA